MGKYFNGISVIILTVIVIAGAIRAAPIYWALPLVAMSDLIRKNGLFGHYVMEMFKKDKVYTTKYVLDYNKA